MNSAQRSSVDNRVENVCSPPVVALDMSTTDTYVQTTRAAIKNPISKRNKMTQNNCAKFTK